VNLDFPYAGETYSLVCAFVWAVAVILFRKSGELVPPGALNLFKNVLAFALFIATTFVTRTNLFPGDRTAIDWLALLASGALGLGVADWLFLASLNRIGASRSAVVDCFYTPCLFLLSWLYLAEPLRPLVLVAGGLVVAAVLVGTFERPAPGEVPLARLFTGVALGLGAMFVLAAAVVIAKPVLVKADPWWAISVRLAGGLALTCVVGIAGTDRAAIARAFLPSRAWRVTVPAALVGTYLSMTLWILGIKFANVSRAGVLNQTCSIFTLVLAAIFLKEKLTARRVIAIALGVLSAVLVSLDRVQEG
jgi:drug/metabolite transporter (DMT)-like permease